ncbi:IQ calmodulin-binding motif-containing protein 1 isoform X5 [Balaenoptera acutorostrata]|uniref:IQ calmodulin-binding motif-containing protein 1 isoform X5 n=1 Tax=Balaenoptera acutorostrata TaxID=9767 RepID=A0ABM3TG39_BALAC|nr:IQ calmodulin-binding motif-containing protein 1 isoform X5 [Balaenoptera acutorostrata]
MKAMGTDPRILSLAAEVAISPEQNVPVILLKLKEIINNTPFGSSELKKVKQDIYCYDLIRYCLLVLSQDCSRIQGGWTTISQLTQILSHCCVGLEPGEDAEEFYNELLPSAAENFLVLGRQLQTCFINAAKGEEKDALLHFFEIVTDSLFWLLGGHVQLIQNATARAWWQLGLCTRGVEPGPPRQRRVLGGGPRPGALRAEAAVAGVGMSGSSKVVLGLLVVLTAATMAGVHMKQRQDQQRLRDGVIRDIERQNRKKENIRLLGEQILLTEQLEAEREKMVLAKGSQKT